MKYRVKERGGKFIIQGEMWGCEGCLWWKKKVYSWSRVDVWGNPIHTWSMRMPLLSEEYTNLKDALSGVESFKEVSKYHEIKER